MMTFFIVGSFWFWSLIVTATVLLFIAMAHDAFWKATLVIVATLVVLGFFGAGYELRNVGSYIWHHPLQFVSMVIGYMVVGAMWSIFKWDRHLKNIRQEAIANETKLSSYAIKNMVRDNKGRLIGWMSYWPISIVWSALSDPFQEIYKRLTGTFEKLVTKHLGSLEKD